MYNKLLSLVFISFLSLGIFAQSNQDEIELMQFLYGMEKRDIVTEFIELSEVQEQKFWTLYDASENHRNELGKKKLRLLQSYVDDYRQVKSEDADNFMKQVIPLRIKSGKLTDNYYKKIKTKTDPIVAMQFYQIENYLADAIKMELLEDTYTTKKNNV